MIGILLLIPIVVIAILLNCIVDSINNIYEYLVGIQTNERKYADICQKQISEMERKIAELEVEAEVLRRHQLKCLNEKRK